MLPHFDGDRPRIMHLLACFSGIMIFFLVYGLTQEKIMTTSYDETGSDGGRFKDTAFLVFINRIVSIMVSLIIMIWLKPEPLRPSVPLHFYGIISISNFLSTFCQYEALKYVTFPIQTLGKCAKMIPVLVIGTITGRKQYSWREYLIGIVVMCGCFIFLTTGENTSGKIRHSSEAATQTIGLMLLMAYLAFDGTTSTTQERLFKNYQITTNNQMLYVNISSAILGIFALIIPWKSIINGGEDGEQASRLFPAFHFAFSHPRLIVDALTLSLCSSLGQLIIYYTIKEFGALTYSTIMTTRQFFSILLSSLVFLHPIAAPQWFGALLVFGALYSSAVMKQQHQTTRMIKKRGSDSELPLAR